VQHDAQMMVPISLGLVDLVAAHDMRHILGAPVVTLSMPGSTRGRSDSHTCMDGTKDRSSPVAPSRVDNLDLPHPPHHRLHRRHPQHWHQTWRIDSLLADSMRFEWNVFVRVCVSVNGRDEHWRW